MHKIRWDDLQFVHAVAENGSLSGAARALGVNHATVLRRISALEHEIGVRLFQRPPGGYRLTPEGQEMLSSLQAIGRTVERLERQIPSLGSGLEGTVRVTTTDSIANCLLPRHLGRIAAENPGLDIELIVSNMPMNLARPEAEITLRPAQNLPEGLAGREIGPMGFGIFAHRDYIAANPGRHVSDHMWLGVASPLTRSPVGRWQDRVLGDRVVLCADSFMTLAHMAAAGMGPAMLPSLVGRTTPGLATVPGLDDRMETRLWAASHIDIAPTARIKALTDILADAIGRDAALIR